MIVRVRVPATSANLGSGFDTLGLALGLYNEVEVEAAPAAGLKIVVEGEGAAELQAQGAQNLVVRAMEAAFQAAGRRPTGLRARFVNRIPLGRGLGRSSAAAVAGIAAGARLVGEALAPDEVLRLALPFEGHPDNIAPCVLGGFTVAAAAGGRVHCLRVPMARPLRAVAVIPEVRLATADARRALPSQVPLADAVFNVNRAALLVAALGQGRFDLLREAVADRLHQPYRAPLLPGMMEVIEAGYGAGALACFLSGAGSTVLALADGREEAIGAAMQARWRDGFRTQARVRILAVDQQGLHYDT
jgi:homoserine kinase